MTSQVQEATGSGAGSSSIPPASPSPAQENSPSPSPEPEEDPATRAEKVKERGNVAFKAGRYGEAIDLYTQAIGVYPEFFE
jgi:DnaJ family protein C protein 7